MYCTFFSAEYGLILWGTGQFDWFKSIKPKAKFEETNGREILRDGVLLSCIVHEIVLKNDLMLRGEFEVEQHDLVSGISVRSNFDRDSVLEDDMSALLMELAFNIFSELRVRGNRGEIESLSDDRQRLLLAKLFG
jgi:hypothetical protein